MSLSRIGKPKKGKAVIQLSSDGEVIATYMSVSMAARSVGTTIQNISTVLKGKGNTAKGFKWRYAECAL